MFRMVTDEKLLALVTSLIPMLTTSIEKCHTQKFTNNNAHNIDKNNHTQSFTNDRCSQHRQKTHSPNAHSTGNTTQ